MGTAEGALRSMSVPSGLEAFSLKRSAHQTQRSLCSIWLVGQIQPDISALAGSGVDAQRTADNLGALYHVGQTVPA